MWNPVASVAKSFFLPEPEFAFDPFGLLGNFGNFWVDALIADFKAEFPELCERTRVDKVAALRAHNLNNFGPRG